MTGEGIKEREDGERGGGEEGGGVGYYLGEAINRGTVIIFEEIR